MVKWKVINISCWPAVVIRYLNFKVVTNIWVILFSFTGDVTDMIPAKPSHFKNVEWATNTCTVGYNVAGTCITSILNLTQYDMAFTKDKSIFT